MEAIAEEIEARNTRLGMIDENEDLAELMNPQKIREMKREIKLFEKQQLKYQKLLEKEQNKDKGKKKVVIDKVDDEVDEALDTPTAHGNVAEDDTIDEWNDDDLDDFELERQGMHDDEYPPSWSDSYEEDDVYEDGEEDEKEYVGQNLGHRDDDRPEKGGPYDW